jgi:hypothetical protein
LLATLTQIIIPLKMDIDNSFLQSIYNEDTIYHYTKASTAIDFIFQTNELKFGHARKSNDPIESRKARRSTIYFGSEIKKSDRSQQ